MILIKKLQKCQLCHQKKIDKYEYLTGEETLPPDQRRVIEQDKFTYSPLGKILEKQKKIKDQVKKQIKVIEDDKKNQIIKSNQIIIMNYCLQRKEKYLQQKTQ